MPTVAPSKPRTTRIKKTADVDTTVIVKKKVARIKKAAQVQEPQHISSGAGMTVGLELWVSTTGQVELRDTTADSRFTADVSAWSSLNAAALKKSKDAATQ